MDQKKVLEKLLKIAENQQKIIMKLAQGAMPPDSLPTGGSTFTPGQDPGPAPAPSPDRLDPNKQQHTDLQSKVLAANPKLASVIASISYGAAPGTVNVSFKPGQATQANYDAVKAAVGAAGVQAKVHVV